MARVKLFKHGRQAGAPAYASPYLLEILSTQPGAPAWVSATGSLVANNPGAQVVSCSRASSGYCLGDDGLLHLLGSNTVRVEPTGLLVEGASTNFFIRSTDFSQGWSFRTALASAVQNVTGPDGVTNSAWTLTLPAAGSGVSMYQGVGAATATVSCYVKQGTARYVGIDNAEGFTSTFDWNTLTWNNNAGTGTTRTESLGNGWYRLSVSTTAGAAGYTSISWSNTANVGKGEFTPCDGTSLIIWQAQYETLIFPTSPIITGAAAATRAADVVTCTNPLSGNGQFRVGATVTPLNGTFVNTGGITRWAYLSAGTWGAANNWWLGNDSGQGYFRVWDNAGGQKDNAFTPTPGTSHAFEVYTPNAGATPTIYKDGASISVTPGGAGTNIITTQGATFRLGDTVAGQTSYGHMTNIFANNT